MFHKINQLYQGTLKLSFKQFGPDVKSDMVEIADGKLSKIAMFFIDLLRSKHSYSAMKTHKTSVDEDSYAWPVFKSGISQECVKTLVPILFVSAKNTEVIFWQSFLWAWRKFLHLDKEKKK